MEMNEDTLVVLNDRSYVHGGFPRVEGRYGMGELGGPAKRGVESTEWRLWKFVDGTFKSSPNHGVYCMFTARCQTIL